MEIPEEGKETIEAAREILEDLLGLMDVPASVTQVDGVALDGDEDSPATVVFDVRGEDPGVLIGRRGQTLASLQYIVRIISAHRTGEQFPVIIDVEGYKHRRWDALRSLARRMAEQVQTTGEPFALEPMSAFERRVVHLALAAYPGITTESSGLGETRKVVILPE